MRVKKSSQMDEYLKRLEKITKRVDFIIGPLVENILNKKMDSFRFDWLNYKYLMNYIYNLEYYILLMQSDKYDKPDLTLLRIRHGVNGLLEKVGGDGRGLDILDNIAKEGKLGNHKKVLNLLKTAKKHV